MEETFDEYDSFNSHGQQLVSSNNKVQNSYELKKKAVALEYDLDVSSNVPVQSNSNSKKFVTKGGKKMGPVKAGDGNNWRFNSSSENPHEAQFQNDRLTKLIIERAQKMKH